jgi:hypothetical protein
MEKSYYSPSITARSIISLRCRKLARKVSYFGRADGYEKLPSVPDSEEKISSRTAIMSWMRDFMHPHQAARAEKLRTAKLIHTRGILEMDPDKLELLPESDLLCIILVGAEGVRLETGGEGERLRVVYGSARRSWTRWFLQPAGEFTTIFGLRRPGYGDNRYKGDATLETGNM